MPRSSQNGQIQVKQGTKCQSLYPIYRNLNRWYTEIEL